MQQQKIWAKAFSLLTVGFLLVSNFAPLMEVAAQELAINEQETAAVGQVEEVKSEEPEQAPGRITEEAAFTSDETESQEAEKSEEALKQEESAEIEKVLESGQVESKEVQKSIVEGFLVSEEVVNADLAIHTAVKTGVVYKSTDSLASIKFDRIDSQEAVTLNIEKVAVVSGVLDGKPVTSGYKFTTTPKLPEGSFEAVVSLPVVGQVNAESELKLQYSEDGVNFKEEDTQVKTEQNGGNFEASFTVNHFTVFIVISPNPVGNGNIGNSDCSAAGIDGTCYDTIQAAIAAAVDGDVIEIRNGNYTIASTINVDKELTIRGESRAGVNIDMSAVSGYGWNITADNVTIENMTVQGTAIVAATSRTFKFGNPMPIISNGTLRDITVTNGNRTPFDIHGVDGFIGENLTATGTVSGVGLSLTGVNGATITGFSGSANAWGDIAIFASTYTTPNRGSSNINIIDNGNIGVIYGQDSSTSLRNDLGSITIAGRVLLYPVVGVDTYYTYVTFTNMAFGQEVTGTYGQAGRDGIPTCAANDHVYTNQADVNGRARQVLEWTPVAGAQSYRYHSFSWNGTRWNEISNNTISATPTYTVAGYDMARFNNTTGFPTYTEFDTTNNVFRYVTMGTAPGTYTRTVEAWSGAGATGTLLGSSEIDAADLQVGGAFRNNFNVCSRLTIDRTAPAAVIPEWGWNTPAGGYLANSGTGLTRHVTCGGTITDINQYRGLWAATTEPNFFRYERDVFYNGSYVGTYNETNNYTGAFTSQFGTNPNGGEGVYYVRIRAVDLAGNASISNAAWANKTLPANPASDPNFCQLNIDINLETPVQIGYNFNNGGGDTGALPRPTTEIVCRGGTTDVNSVAVHWLHAGGTNIKYQRQYAINGGAWTGNEIYTTQYTNFRQFGSAAGNPATYQSRVRAFYDANNNNQLDGSESFSNWSNTCQIRFVLAQATPANAEIQVCKEDVNANRLAGWEMSLDRAGAAVGNGQATVMNFSDISGTNAGNFPAGVYRVNVTGTYRYGSSAMIADAGYSYRPASLGAANLGCDCWYDGDQLTTVGGLEVKINGNNIDWGMYNAGHSYTHYYTHAGGAMNFSVYDNAYGDNTNIDMVISVVAADVNQTTAATATADNGCTTFSVLPGQYSLSETMQPNWEFISRSDSGNNGSVVNLVAGGNPAITFTNRLLRSEIYWFKVVGDIGPGVAIAPYIQNSFASDLQINSTSSSFTTTIDNPTPASCNTVNVFNRTSNCHQVAGRYTELDAGEYQISEINVPTGFEFSWARCMINPFSPAGTIAAWGPRVTANPGEFTASGMPVGAVGSDTIDVTVNERIYCVIHNEDLSSISGSKIIDNNSNAVNDAGDFNQAGWTINLYNAGWSAVASQSTDASGDYSFQNLRAGTYYICEEDRAGFVQTAVTGGNSEVAADASVTASVADRCQRVELAYNTDRADVDFLNFELGSIAGIKFNDSNPNPALSQDGVYDMGVEPGVPGFTIFIDENSNQAFDGGEVSVVTGAAGEYIFTGLNAGTYSICEVNQVGWTAPAGGVCQSVVIATSGQDVTDVNFANYQPITANLPSISIAGFEIDEARLDQVIAGVNATTVCNNSVADPSESLSQQCSALIWEVRHDGGAWTQMHDAASMAYGAFNLPVGSQNENARVQNYVLGDFYNRTNNFFIDNPASREIRVRFANFPLSAVARVAIDNINPAVTLTANVGGNSVTNVSGGSVPTLNITAGQAVSFSGSFTDQAGVFDGHPNDPFQARMNFGGTGFFGQTITQSNNVSYQVTGIPNRVYANGTYAAVLRICEENNLYGACGTANITINVTGGTTGGTDNTGNPLPDGAVGTDTQEDGAILGIGDNAEFTLSLGGDNYFADEGKDVVFALSAAGTSLENLVCTWDFGDGSAKVSFEGIEQNKVRHSYSQGGNYKVTVECEDKTTGTKQTTTSSAIIGRAAAEEFNGGNVAGENNSAESSNQAGGINPLLILIPIALIILLIIVFFLTRRREER
jgi:hypothetical protein